MVEKVGKNKSKGSEESFYLPFDNLVDPAMIIDRRGVILKVTKAVEEISGFKRGELMGKRFFDVDAVTEESKHLLKENFAKRMRGERVERYEFEALAKDGTRIPVELNATLIEYKGEPADLVVFRDITERKKLEDRIKAEREVYQSIARAANRSRTVEEICKLALKGIRMVVKYDLANISIYRESKNILFPVAQIGYPEEVYEKTIKRQDLKGQRVIARAVRRRKSVYIDNMKTSKLTSYVHDLIVKYDISTLYAVPLFSWDKLQGVLEVLTTGNEKLSKEDREVLDTISDELAGGIAKAKIEETLLTVKEAFKWVST